LFLSLLYLVPRMRKSIFRSISLVASFSLVAGSGSDVCGGCNGFLNVPNMFFPGQTVNAGLVNSCICLSGLPNFIATNPAAIVGVSFAGKAAVTQALTDMINSGKPATCYYPDHSVPQCQFGNPCGFTCTDGYSPYPAFGTPTNCVCSPPYTVCNGQCGLYKACPSYGYSKRSLTGSPNLRCSSGMEACPIIGRSSQSWECVDTQYDLESCGGCIVASHPAYNKKEGIDCTAIHGVSDVSCVSGKCLVERCMPGYSIGIDGDSCIPNNLYHTPYRPESGIVSQNPV